MTFQGIWKRIINIKLVQFIILTLSLYIYSDSAPSHFTISFSKSITKASSFLKEKKRSYPAQQVVDSKLETAWCEGAKGPGIGETLEVQFQPTVASRISVLNGYGENRNFYENNNRVKDYEITYTTRNGRSF